MILTSSCLVSPLFCLADGQIAGFVRQQNGAPIEGADVLVYGTDSLTTTDAKGAYRFTGIESAAPRYIVTAEKTGYRIGQQGFVDVLDDSVVEVDFLLLPDDQFDTSLQGDTLEVALATLLDVQYTDVVLQPTTDAVLDPDLYPKTVMPYLEPGIFITPDHPAVTELANQIMASVPRDLRQKTTVVAKAVYDWVVLNIEYDLMENFVDDVTSGNWQTNFGGWGKNVSDWAYTPAELINEKRAVCIEYERLTTSLLRALGIPARVAPLVAHPVTQWWNQNPDGSGYWVNMETSRGRLDWVQLGNLRAAFPGVKEHQIGFYGIDADAPIHMDWNCDDKCIWSEFGIQMIFEHNAAGLIEASKGMNVFRREGEFSLESELASLQIDIRAIKESFYFVNSRGASIDLSGLQDQDTLIFRFPLYKNNAYRTALATGHWTNHPEWLTSTHVTTEYNERSEESLDYMILEFNFPAGT